MAVYEENGRGTRSSKVKEKWYMNENEYEWHVIYNNIFLKN